MNVLIIGSGGREHALAWKLAQSPRVKKIYCAPGNAGTAEVAENIAIGVMDFPALVNFAKEKSIALTVVGPDDPLAAGVADAFQAAGLPVFGPTASAARFEASKSYAKDFMQRHGIPTARYAVFTESAAARAFCEVSKFPLVVKADGLALGKGVVIANTLAEALEAVTQAMDKGAFGEAGRRVVIEEFLQGPECSIHAVVDASGYCLFPDARDHKRAHDNDEGPNTGGMGTVSPSGVLDDALWRRIREEVLDRFVAGLRKDGIAFQGMLFPGLMITADGPKVLEFNCRFGDPETQVLLPRLSSDLLDILEAAAENRVAAVSPTWRDESAACVVLASGGYPAKYETGKPIEGLPRPDVFHAGTRRENERVVTSGGRVLGVFALGKNLDEARANAYDAVTAVSFDKMHYRRDIGA